MQILFTIKVSSVGSSQFSILILHNGRAKPIKALHGFNFSSLFDIIGPALQCSHIKRSYRLPDVVQVVKRQ